MNSETSRLAAEGGLQVFSTALGHCGIAWGAHGVLGLQLPEGDESATRRRLARRFPTLQDAAPSAAAAAAMQGVIELLTGGDPDLSHIDLDFSQVPDFHRRVYALARAIPRGATRTYGELARELGDLALARAVGQALGANPFPPIVPCHRILSADGNGGFSAHGGVATKLRMLAIEEAKGLQLSMF
ncbi:MAG: methylated-DNA--[protein]-cysteine S-methyltransferase [Gammaproteobacteria bacterium]